MGVLRRGDLGAMLAVDADGTASASLGLAALASMVRVVQ